MIFGLGLLSWHVAPQIDSAVDAMMLLVPPTGGDELQGVKKGIIEVSTSFRLRSLYGVRGVTAAFLSHN